MKQFSYSRTALLCTALFNTPSFAATTPMDVITITAPASNAQQTELAEGNLTAPDVGHWLDQVPGANRNDNGTISGFAQYRGQYGDRVATLVGGNQLSGAGSNGMDAPLSYAPSVMVDRVEVYRGIAPVSVAPDTFGGAVVVALKKASTDKGNEGQILLSTLQPDPAHTAAARLAMGSGSYGGQLFFSRQVGHESEDGLGRATGRDEYEREQFGLDMALESDNGLYHAAWLRTNTGNALTAALPMDIDYIRTSRFTLDGRHQTSLGEVNWRVGYQDADHGMDNFSDRQVPNDSKKRYTHATSESIDARLTLARENWLYGLDIVHSNHDANLSNPSAESFFVINFAGVKDSRYSLFAEWNGYLGAHSVTAGGRVKWNQADADEVGSSMAMMNPMVLALQQDFNNADRSQRDLTYDLALSVRHPLSNTLSVHAATAVKQRAAGYQARYLWLPMQASGGLADGKTYVGDVTLSPETAYQLNLGLDARTTDWQVSPQLFYQRIDDYITGRPSVDMRVRMVASMMGDPLPLQFANQDARLYGADLNWRYNASNALSFSGTASYVRGDNRDTDEALYRIAPLNARFNLHYQNGDWAFNTGLKAYARQNRVAALNNERPSAGYAVVDMGLTRYFGAGLLLKANVENLFDRFYAPHLSGLNRAAGSELALGEKLPAPGRRVSLMLEYSY